MTATSTTAKPAFLANLWPFAQQQGVKILPSAIAILVFLVIWQLLCMGEGSNLPPPTTVLTETWDLIIDPFFDNGGNDKGLFWQIMASLQRVAVGFTLSTVVGVGVGILIGSSAKVYSALDPIFQLLRTIPPLAWLPISLAALQESETSAIFVIFITAIWPILINTAVGVQQVPQDYRNVSKVLQLSRMQYFFNVLLPAAAPYIFTGLKIGIGLAWLAIVAAEMLLGGVGIGFFIWDAWNSSQISELILALVYIGLVGLLLDRLIDAVSRLIVSEDV
ncbi:nitrate ABC transporter permease [Synechococcales cyanobacterium C]|uniref:Nitrate ABC transporter permease n=1 Tax=Petrachloros mirabilis ULC683 TaxID=2781853 RepID=A0A8K1ZZW8_9CYAN|nr:nitrate ABC transporter permease [Petrachloros mirabilis]NCJ06787.1 nitrate ABC transporter permease [Petrachloros mirabilis ULC683]